MRFVNDNSAMGCGAVLESLGGFVHSKREPIVEHVVCSFHWRTTRKNQRRRSRDGLEKGQKQTKRLKCISFWTSIEVSLALAVEGVRLSYDYKRALEQGVVSFLVEFYFLAFMYSLLKVKGQCQLISFNSKMW